MHQHIIRHKKKNKIKKLKKLKLLSKEFTSSKEIKK